MNIDGIKQLVQLMIEHDLTEIDITDGESKVLLKRGSAAAPVVTVAPAAPAPAPAAPAQAPATEFVEIRSPMVGTFYASPSPDSDPYLRVGDAVDDETVACIVEAMKVMNEIKAECSGTVAEVCVRNAQPVEYGQVLFRLKPA